MTPAITTLVNAGIKHLVHEYLHDPSRLDFGVEAAEKLNVEATRIFKTLVVETESKTLAVGIVPVSGSLRLKSLAKALGVKKVAMADKARVERTTGYVLGGVSPVGCKHQMPTIIDHTAMNHATIFVSAGKRGLELELSPFDLCQLLEADTAEIAG